MIRRTRSIAPPLFLVLAACGGIEGTEAVDEQAVTSVDLFDTLLDRDETGWASVRGLTSAEFSADFAERSAKGYMLIDVEVDEIAGNERVSGVWIKNTDGRAWKAHRNLTSAEYGQKWSTYSARGYVPIDQESYVLGGSRYYAGVWVENREGVRWASFRNLTSASFSSRFDQYSSAGYMPIDVEGYPVGSNGRRYAIIWIENTGGHDWYLRRDMTAAAYAGYFDQYDETHRVMDLESYTYGDARRYAAIWIENTNGRRWKAYRDMTKTSYANKWKALSDAGYRVTDFEIYPYGSSTRYAAVWRQNNRRPQWKYKAFVDGIVEDAYETKDVPGMTVAVMSKGDFAYVRGMGFADIGDDEAAFGGTIYRLASVSKVVAGALALDLDERNLLDRSAATRDYVSSLPNHHTHKIWHLLTYRSGIGHYDENGAPAANAHFDTATEALAFFEDNPLEFTPNTDAMYTTHAFTVFGAAVEAALGGSIDEIMLDEFTNRYGLGTLRPEDRDDGNPNRATLYAYQKLFPSWPSMNLQVGADDLSWKRMGGGLESNAYDLARFGQKLIDGDILGDKALYRLWTRPNNLSNYAYGWYTTTNRCQKVVAKGGAQIGSRAHIRLYPDMDVVIVVLANGPGDGFDPSAVAFAIGDKLAFHACK